MSYEVGFAVSETAATTESPAHDEIAAVGSWLKTMQTERDDLNYGATVHLDEALRSLRKAYTEQRTS